jgi:hypothetical protein
MDDADILAWLGALPKPPPPTPPPEPQPPEPKSRPPKSNPLPGMTYFEQALQFKVQVIGPLGKRTIKSALVEIGFELIGGNWWKESSDGTLGAISFARDGGIFVLTYDSMELSAWRRKCKRFLRPGEPSYKPEPPPPSVRRPGG